jgi:hypothetical protein
VDSYSLDAAALALSQVRGELQAMSTTRGTTLWCDSDSCGIWIQLDGTIPRVRALARRQGWSYVTGKAKDGSKKKFDLCSYCTRGWDELLGR